MQPEELALALAKKGFGMRLTTNFETIGYMRPRVISSTSISIQTAVMEWMYAGVIEFTKDGIEHNPGGLDPSAYPVRIVQDAIRNG